MPPVATAVLGCHVVDKAPRSARVLCVEDDSATRAGYIAYLAGRGDDVRAAATGEEALALASARAPQVIVLQHYD